MIALDTSSVIAFFAGDEGDDRIAVRQALQMRLAVLPPVVVTELLSDRLICGELLSAVTEIPALETREGYWRRPLNCACDFCGSASKRESPFSFPELTAYL